MFSWRSARGRAVLTGTVFVLLLVAMMALAVWRARDDQERHSLLERRSAVVSTLENARAQSYLAGTWAVISLVVDDPFSFYDLYRQATQLAQEDLDQAQGELISLGAKEELDALSEVLNQRQQFVGEMDTLWAVSLSVDRNARAQVAQEQLSQMWSLSESFILGLDQLAKGQQDKLAAERGAADGAVDTTLTLFIAFGLISIVAGTATTMLLIMSIVRPLAGLRKSARAIASGDLQTKAKVLGPEEVASLARDFNEMVAARGLVEYALRERNQAVAERARELDCLYNLSALAQTRDISLSQMLQSTTDLLPPAWQYPEVTCARITFEGQVLTTDNFRETKWRQASDIVVHGRPSGTVEVRYLHEKPEREEGPFLDAERRLLNAVAERLGHMIERKQAEEALQESEARYKALFVGAPEGMLVADLQTRQLCYANPTICRMFGYTEEEFLRMGVTDLMPKEFLGYVLAEFEAQARGEKRLSPDVPCQRKDGSLLYASISGIKLVLGGRECMVGVFTDVTERKRMEEELRESEARYRHIFENVYDIFYQADTQGILTQLSPSIKRYGYTPEELVGTPVLNLYESPEERSALLEAIFKQGQVTDYEIRLKAADGHQVITSANTRLLRDADGAFAGVEGILRDVTERKRAEEAVREQAQRDPLTGALNHGAIVEELRNLLSGHHDSDSHAVAMVDVDGLKAVNDTYGHQVGDAVLVAVAGALSRDGALVGRYGGDEFVALLRGADKAAAERYRDAVHDALASVRLTDPETGATIPVASAIGLAVCPQEADNVADLISLSDSAMYEAKRQRPLVSVGKALSRPLGSERAAKMVGEIVPLLTSPGDLNDKLRLVAHRLSTGGGYNGVSFLVFQQPSRAPGAQNTLAQTPAAQNTFAKVADDIVEAWTNAQRQAKDIPLRRILQRTRHPIILDDPQHDRRLAGEQRELLRAAGLRTALVAPMIWQNELIGTLSVASKREAAFGPRDAEFLMTVATQVTAIVRMSTLVEELQSVSDHLVQAHTETVMLLAASAEAHDHATGLHLENVRAITEALAHELDYGEEEAKELGLAAVLHDIGKVRVPDFLLNSTGALADEEWELMKHHTTWGAEFLAGRPGFELAATIARSHHEHWDGSGYPDGLTTEAIPVAATIVAVADSFDAMTSDRPYRAARSVAAAMREIVACSGKQFSPRVVQALVRLHRRRQLPYPRQRAPEEKAAA
jgi:diguanylate cyclase (GGDEF)-like protein/PAS domain S-box-containing protein